MTVAAAAAHPVVAAGKRLRFTAVQVSYQSLAAAGAAVVRVRLNLAGVATVTSPLVAAWHIGSGAAVAGVTTGYVLALPDGFEVPAGAGFGVGVQGLNAAGAAAAAGLVFVSLFGFEYLTEDPCERHS